MTRRVPTLVLLLSLAPWAAAEEPAPPAGATPPAPQSVAVPAEAAAEGPKEEAATPMSPQDVEMEQKLRAAIEAEPNAAQPYARLATFLMGHNRASEAVENYQQAIMRDPENAALFVAIALAYLHDGHHERATLMAQEALRLNPELGNAKKLLEYIAESEAGAEAH